MANVEEENQHTLANNNKKNIYNPQVLNEEENKIANTHICRRCGVMGTHLTHQCDALIPQLSWMWGQNQAQDEN